MQLSVSMMKSYHDNRVQKRQLQYECSRLIGNVKQFNLFS